ncbi:hypothetical protein BC831DRAFT_406230 [Entophlyctis helioformis]|nr:hypothetical protein BC831DRAFT_406230 [Entophlyctis helioformis]
MLYVATQRYRLYNKAASMPFPTNDNLASAHKILAAMSFLEFPFLQTKSLEFGFFKTYAIPSISKLLLATGEMTSFCERRLVDTELLVREFSERPLSSERAQTAIRRMNHLHSKYKISNEDYLYVLAVFIVEPVHWVRKYGYRKMHPNEVQANYVHWRSIAVRMGITDIPPTFEAVEKYMTEFEARKMVFSESNRKVGQATIDEFLRPFPKFLHGMGQTAIYALSPPNLRAAMGFPDPPFGLHAVLSGCLTLAGLFVRFFMLPRTKPTYRTGKGTGKDGGDGRETMCPAFRVYDSDIRMSGYRVDDLGPKKYEGDGGLGELHTERPNSFAAF